jgi:hypothetical protein
MTSPVDRLVAVATDNADAAGNAGAAGEAIDAARAAELPQPEPVRVAPEPVGQVSRKAPKNKTELLAALAERDAAIASMQAQLNALQDRSAAQAVDGLSAALSDAMILAGDIMASMRGPHWRFTDAEAQPVGDAWAPILAPYADKLTTVMPWGIAITVTWRALRPRLQRDSELKQITGGTDAETSEAEAGQSAR